MDPSDTFSFNNNFTCPMRKIKVGTVSNKVENKEERKETRERVEEERKYQTDVRCVAFSFIFYLWLTFHIRHVSSVS